jgi:hypothetical protein
VHRVLELVSQCRVHRVLTLVEGLPPDADRHVRQLSRGSRKRVSQIGAVGGDETGASAGAEVGDDIESWLDPVLLALADLASEAEIAGRDARRGDVVDKRRGGQLLGHLGQRGRVVAVAQKPTHGLVADRTLERQHRMMGERDAVRGAKRALARARPGGDLAHGAILPSAPAPVNETRAGLNT